MELSAYENQELRTTQQASSLKTTLSVTIVMSLLSLNTAVLP